MRKLQSECNRLLNLEAEMAMLRPDCGWVREHRWWEIRKRLASWMGMWDLRFRGRYRHSDTLRMMNRIKPELDKFVDWLNQPHPEIEAQYRQGRMSQTTGFDWYYDPTSALDHSNHGL